MSENKSCCQPPIPKKKEVIQQPSTKSSNFKDVQKYLEKGGKYFSLFRNLQSYKVKVKLN